MESTIQAPTVDISIAPPSGGVNSASPGQSSLLGDITQGRPSSSKPNVVNPDVKPAYQNSREQPVDVNKVKEDQELSLEGFEQEENDSKYNKVAENRKPKIPVENNHPEAKLKDESEKENQAKIEKETDKFDIDFNEDDAEEEKKNKVEQEKTKGVEQQQLNKKRDFTGFEAEDVETLKRLPNHLFDKYKERIKTFYEANKKVKELETKVEGLKKNALPDSYYEHPDSYVLNPQYNQMMQDSRQFEFEVNHYRQQLINVKSGKPWQAITGYDNSGRPKFSNVPAKEDGSIDVEAEINITTGLGEGQRKLAEYSGAIQGLQQQHQQQYKQSLEALQKADDTFFPAFKDQTKLPESVRNNYNKALNSVPGVFKNHPLAQMIAKAFAAHVYKDQQIAKLKEQLQVKASVKQDSVEAGPGPGKFNGGLVNGGEKVFDIKEFK